MLEADAPNLGVIVSVRGSVVDMRFDAQLPPIYTVLRTGKEKQIVIEVLAQLDARHVRGIALTPTQGLARGMAVKDRGGPLQVPVGKGLLSRSSRNPRLLPASAPVWMKTLTGASITDGASAPA